MAALAFYFVFNEKLGFRHIFGIIAVSVSIVMISNGRYDVEANIISKDAGVTEADKINVLIPVFLTLANSCILVINTLIARVIKVSRLSIC